ncbi:MAG: hypothetical protein AAGG48_31300 [Planctomycetota bacterium]
MRTRIFPNRLRLGIFGPADAGKTNHLVALASPHMPNPRQFRSVWMEGLTNADNEAFGSAIEGRELPDDVKAAYLEGIDWLSRSRAKMLRGEIVDANDNTREASRFAFQFHGPRYPLSPDVKSNEAVSFEAELIDYSGEMLKSGTKINDRSRRVRTLLRECDGLVVVAEAPRKGKTEGDIARHLSEVEAVFTAIANDNKANEKFCPVALLINKWDRYAPDWEYDPKEVKSKLDTFFTEHPLYRSFRDSVSAAAGNDRFEEFLCSAFGKSRLVYEMTDRGKVAADAPAAGDCLHSYGLEDPFFWLHSSAERHRLNSIRADDANLGHYRPFASRKIGEHEARIRESHGLFRGSDQVRRELVKFEENAKQKKLTSRIALSCITLLSLVACLQIGKAWSDFAAEGEYSKMIGKPAEVPSQSKLEALDEARNWYQDYSQRSVNRILSRALVLSRRAASEKSKEIAELQNQLIPIYELDASMALLEKKIQASDVEGEFDLVDDQLAEYESQIGLIGDIYLEQLNQKAAHLRSKLDYQRGDAIAKAWERQAEDVLSQVNSARTLRELDAIQETLEKLATDSFGDRSSGPFQELRTSFRSKRQQIIEATTAENLEREFMQALSDAEDAGGLKQLRNAAALLLSASQSSHGSASEAMVKKLSESFRGRAVPIMSSIVSRQVKLQMFEEAKQIFHDLNSPGYDDTLSLVVGADTIEEFLANRVNLLDHPMERHYYQALIRLRTEDAARAYLSGLEDSYRGQVVRYYTPGVKQVVDAWLQFQIGAAKRTTRQVRLGNIEYKGALGLFETKQYLSVQVDDATVRFASTKNRDAAYLTSIGAAFTSSERAFDGSHRVGELPTNRALTDVVEIRVIATDVRDSATIGWGGEAMKEVRLSEVAAEPVVFQLRKDGADTGLSLALQLAGEKEEPKLRPLSDLAVWD